MNSPMDEIEVFYKSNIRYEITICPNDKHQFHGSPRRLQLWIMDMQKCLTKAFDYYGILYRLYWELSEPRAINKEDNKKSSGSRLHFHGYVEFKSDLIVGNFLLKSLYMLGRWSDVQVNSYRKAYWSKYIVKQSLVVKALSKDYAVPICLKDHQKEIRR